MGDVETMTAAGFTSELPGLMIIMAELLYSKSVRNRVFSEKGPKVNKCF